MENLDLKKALEKAMDDALPKMAGESLKRRLDEADKMERTIKELEGRLDLREGELEAKAIIIKNLEEKVKECMERDTEVLSEKDRLETLAKELDQKERNLKVAELTYQLEAEKESTAKIVQLTETAFRNPVVKKQLHTTTPFQPGMTYPEYDKNGNYQGEKWIPAGPPSGDTTTTETTEEV